MLFSFYKNQKKVFKVKFKETKSRPIGLVELHNCSRNIKQNLENLFKHLNQIPEITSKEMYNEALKLFNVEIRKSGRGHIVVVTDDSGNPIRYPIRLSNFKDRPKFYKGLQAENESQINKQVLDKFQIAQWVRDLNKLFEKNKLPYSGKMQKLKKE